MTKNGQEVRREVPRREELQGIYEKFHDQIGHRGINSTLNGIQQYYTWLGMYSEITKYVSVFYGIRIVSVLFALESLYNFGI